jgi:hypothetical protein
VAHDMDRAVTSMSGTNGARSRDHASAGPTPAGLFAVLWDALADLLGTAAAAMLLRRAAQRASKRHPELSELAIVRESLDYRYTLPSAWHDRTAGTGHALRQMVAELLPLLEELTGPLVIRHLAQIWELRDQGIIPPQEEES